MASNAVSGGGVFETDAPDGYKGLVVYGPDNQLVMRIEILRAQYSPEMIPPLQEWIVAQYERQRREASIRLLPP